MQSSLRFLLLAALLAVASCATPVMPTGGPPDRTPPVLISSTPAADSVNVRAERLALRFSKPVEEVSVRRAVSITPDFDAPLEFVVRGSRVEIVFPDELRENTTYVVTIGTELRDLRTNRLPAPITLAFATGPELDTGELAGWVRDPRTGTGVANIYIFAYASPAGAHVLPDPRVAAPDYRTETDTQGRFRLQYLRDDPFFVVAVDDQNRNRRADPGERFASPPEPARRPSSEADTTEVAPLALFVTRVDTLQPEMLRLRPSTDQRLAVRFTEPIRLLQRDPTAFTLTDSASGAPVTIQDVFQDTDPYQLVLRTQPMRSELHRLALVLPGAVVDTAGNPARPGALTFTAPTQPDTARARLAAFEPAGPDTLRTLRPGRQPVVRFTEPPREPPASERIEVRSPAGDIIPADVVSIDGLRYRIEVETSAPFDVRVRQPDSLYTMRFSPLPADSLGELSGVLTDAPEDQPVVIEVRYPDSDPLQTTLLPDGTFMLRHLPAGVAVVRVFVDRDGSRSWDGGLLAPYRAPEPLRVLTDVRIRARWETELEPISLDPAAVRPPPIEPVTTPDENQDMMPARDLGAPGMRN